VVSRNWVAGCVVLPLVNVRGSAWPASALALHAAFIRRDALESPALHGGTACEVIHASQFGAVVHTIDMYRNCELRKLFTLRYLVSHFSRVKPLASGLAHDGASNQ